MTPEACCVCGCELSAGDCVSGLCPRYAGRESTKVLACETIEELRKWGSGDAREIKALCDEVLDLRAEVARVTQAATVSFEVAESERKELEDELAKVRAELEEVNRNVDAQVQAAADFATAQANRANAAERERLMAEAAKLREALDEATDAIDACQSEEGGSGSVFAIDWVRALKLLRDSDAGAWLEAKLSEAQLEMFNTCTAHVKGENTIPSPEFAALLAEHDAKVRERARLAVHAACLEVEENERRAISKGSAPYSTIFRAVTLSNAVNAAVETLAPSGDGGGA